MAASMEPEKIQIIPPDLTGEIKYEKHDRIEGGHGHVCKGLWTTPEGTIASVAVKVLKVLDNRTGRVTSTDLRRFSKRGRREQQVWMRLNHENIVLLLGITTDCSFSFAGPNPTAMISPWMKKGDLFAVLKRSPPPEDTYLLHLLHGVSVGLQHLHSLGIIHGDLYPANVLINDNGNACLTDFGLSFMPEFEGTSYWSKTVGGAMRYRAPELVPPTAKEVESYVGDLTKMCDIYSFGSLLLHVMSGQEPYHNIQDDLRVVICIFSRLHPERPPTAHLTDKRWKLINQCWGTCGDPSSRLTAEEVVEAITTF